MNSIFKRKHPGQEISADSAAQAAAAGTAEDTGRMQQKEPVLPQVPVDIHIPAAQVRNLRELAGLPTRNGRIVRPGLLFRSADLHKATQEDLLLLRELGVKRVVDLRTQWEIDASPDRLLSDWQLHHIPVIHEETLSRSEHGQLRLLEMAADGMESVLQQAYRDLVLSETGRAGWKKFFALLLENEDPILWHCTQGKDRTGMAAALLLHALDVDEDLIVQEYLQTNLYAVPVLKQKGGLLQTIVPASLSQGVRMAMTYAWPSYYEAARQAVQAQYGSWQGYLQQGLGLSTEDLAVLQNRYTLSPEDRSQLLSRNEPVSTMNTGSETHE